MRITVLGSRGEVEEQSGTHRKHSGLLLEAGKTKVLIDVGETEYLDLKPDAVIITHGHIDHFSKGLRDKEIEPPVYATKEVLTLLKEKFGAKFKEEHPIRDTFRIGDVSFTAHKTLHSLKTPSIALRIVQKGEILAYSSDVIYIYDREDFLKNVALYIGDGSSLAKEGTVRRDKETGEVYGHSGVPEQITWALKAGVKSLVFTHWGKEAIEIGDEKLEFMLHKMMKEEASRLKLKEIPILIATDGMVLDASKLVDVGAISPKIFLPSDETVRTGLILVKPHATLLLEGKKQAVVKSIHLKEHLHEPLWLIQDKKVWGIIALEMPIAIDQKQFKELRDKHCISEEEAKQWGFDTKKELYYYPVKLIASYKEGREIDYPAGPQIFVSASNITWLTKLWKIPYEPEKARNEELRDDFRLFCTVQAKLMAGEKVRIEAGKDVFFTKETLKEMILKLLKEAAKRKKEGKFEFHLKIDEYKEGTPVYELWNLVKNELSDEEKALLVATEQEELVKYPPLEQITPEYLQGLKDERLWKLREHLHELYREAGKVNEDIYNAHILVGREIVMRGLPYPPEEEWDGLDRATAVDFLEYPTIKGLKKDEFTLEELLRVLPDSFVLSEPPAQIFIAGSVVNKGKVKWPLQAGEEGRDVDVIIKQSHFDDRIIYELTKKMPSDIAKGLHFVADPLGPLIGMNIPIYQLAYVKVKEPKRITPWEVDTKLAKIVFGKPIVGLKPRSGIFKNEFFRTKDAWEKWGADRIDNQLVVEKKVDGRRFQAHLDKERGIAKLFTEDRQRDRSDALTPIMEEIMKEGKFKNVILDCEIEVFDLGGKKAKDAEAKVSLFEMLPREDTASLYEAPESHDEGYDSALTVGKVPEAMMDGAVVEVYDILWLDDKPVNDLSALERIELVHKVIPKGLYYWRALPYYLAKTRADFFKFIEKVRRGEGSEGAILKVSTSKYPIKWSGESRTTEWLKIKNLKEIDLMVWKRIPKVTKEGKALDQYEYDVVYSIPDNQFDKFYGAVKWKGKSYAPLGRSYSTSERCERGDIVTIMPIRIREYERDGKREFTFMFPAFKQRKPEKKEPDTITTVERIAELGTAPLHEESELSLEPCPFWNNRSICPLRSRMRGVPPPEHFEPKEALKFPIKCRFASLYRCIWLKEYYFLDKEESLEEVGEEL